MGFITNLIFVSVVTAKRLPTTDKPDYVDYYDKLLIEAFHCVDAKILECLSPKCGRAFFSLAFNRYCTSFGEFLLDRGKSHATANDCPVKDAIAKVQTYDEFAKMDQPGCEPFLFDRLKDQVVRYLTEPFRCLEYLFRGVDAENCRPLHLYYLGYKVEENESQNCPIREELRKEVTYTGSIKEILDISKDTNNKLWDACESSLLQIIQEKIKKLNTKKPSEGEKQTWPSGLIATGVAGGLAVASMVRPGIANEVGRWFSGNKNKTGVVKLPEVVKDKREGLSRATLIGVILLTVVVVAGLALYIFIEIRLSRL